MWKIKKNLRANVIMELEYEDFASLRVEKKTNNRIDSYTLFIDIYEVLNEELSFYKMDDMTNILTFIKTDIEYLANHIDMMSDEEYNRWIDNFLIKINEY